MINILFITSGLDKNGTEEFVMNVLRSLNKKQFHADLLIFSQAETANSIEASNYDCKIFRLPPRKSGLVYYRELDYFFKNHQGYYNAVHWNEGEMTTISPIYYAWKYHIPVRIIHAHNSNTSGYFRKVEHWYNKTFNLKYCTHRFACSTLAAEFFFNNKNAVIIKNGIILNRFVFDNITRLKMRGIMGVDENTLVIGHVGRFTQVKNHTFIIDVYKALSQKYDNSRLVLIGDGELSETIKNKVLTLDLQNRVFFPGVQPNVNEWMQAFDVFVMPSLYEGLPFVLVEAQAAGLPCVVADTINKDASIIENFNFLSLKETTNRWADTIIESYNKNNSRDTRAVIEKAGFSISSTVEYLEKIYQS